MAYYVHVILYNAVKQVENESALIGTSFARMCTTECETITRQDAVYENRGEMIPFCELCGLCNKWGGFPLNFQQALH
jgi:hypothetical protein